MIKNLFLLYLIVFIAESSFAQVEPTPLDVTIESYMTGLSNPVDIVFYNDTMFIVDQDGIINMAIDGTELSDPFLNITSIVQFTNERGLLGLAFDPGFDTNRTFYVNYTNNSGNTIIASYQTYDDSLMGDPGTGTILLTIDQPFANHNGGQIKFGPDGYLYIGMGDGGSAGDPGDRSQDPLELLGKMLRIDVTADSYSIPIDNPFVDDSGTLDEIWALGMRNPWRFSFDMETGDLWIGDVGQYDYEEVDFQEASSSGGQNWGWRCYEGLHPFNTSGCGPASDYDDPIFEYDHSGNNCSITGGFVYRGDDSELLNGVYLGIDYCSGYLFGIRRLENNEIESYNFGTNGFGFTAFGQDDNGEMYLAKSNGIIYKIVDPCHSQIPIINYTNDSLIVTNAVNYHWFFNGEEIENSNENFYVPDEFGTYYCIVENEYACMIQSNEIDLTYLDIEEKQDSKFLISPNPFIDEFSISGFKQNVKELTLYTLSGNIIWSLRIENNDLTHIHIPSDLSKGSYMLQLTDSNGNRYTQLIIKK